VTCGTSRVVPGAHRVVGPGTHRGSGLREVHTTLQFHHTLHPRTSLPPIQTRRISREKNQIRSRVCKETSMRRNHNQQPKQNQSASIVSIVGGVVIRESLASGGEGRRGLIGRWQTRIVTASRCFRPATYQGEYPRYMNVASPRSVTRRKRHVAHNLDRFGPRGA
jgi:hypothetical protein